MAAHICLWNNNLQPAKSVSLCHSWKRTLITVLTRCYARVLTVGELTNLPFLVAASACKRLRKQASGIRRCGQFATSFHAHVSRHELLGLRFHRFLRLAIFSWRCNTTNTQKFKSGTL